MRLKIVEAETASIKKEQTLELLLVPQGETVILKAQKPGGHPWCLLSINADGSSFLHPSVTPDIGLEVDSRGKLRLKRD